MKNLLPPRKNIGLSFLIFSFAATAHAALLLDDSFSDGDRTTQSLPSSAAWYSGTNGTPLNAAVGSLTFDLSAGSNLLVGYFTPDDSPATLVAGQRITLNYTFSILGGNTTGGYFNVALLNSNGNRISADNLGISLNAYKDYTGYASNVTPKSNVNGKIALFKRETSSNTLLNTTANPPYTKLDGSDTTISGFRFVDGISYTGTLSIYYDGSNALITQSFSGGSLSGVTFSYTDISPTLDFDTIAFGIQGGAMSSITFTNINVAAVPEPGESAMALLGIVCIGGSLFWRKLFSTKAPRVATAKP